MTRPERAHYTRLAALGCVVCRNNGHPGTPAEIHHLRAHTGAARKAHYTECLPLCPTHHRLGDGSERFGGELGYHVAPRSFEARYGTQRELLEQINGRLAA